MQVLAATIDGLYTVDDDGNPKQLAPGMVEAITAAPDGGCWLLVDRHELAELRGDDVRPVDDSGEELRAVVATDREVFVGTVGAHLLHLLDGRLGRVESFENVDGRDDWTQPWGAPGDARSFATDGHDTVFLNIHVGGILRTQDGGETWMQTIDHTVDVHEVARAADGRLFAATGARGLAVSNDDGGTWTYATDGLHGTYLRAVAPVPDGVLVSASDGPFTHNGAVYKLRDGTTTFERCERGIPARFDGNVDSQWISAAGTTVACAAPDGTLYLSRDAGDTWTVLAAGLPEPRAVLVRD